jgi:hypothetical protein
MSSDFQVLPAASGQPGPTLHHILLSQSVDHLDTALPHICQQGGLLGLTSHNLKVSCLKKCVSDLVINERNAEPV